MTSILAQVIPLITCKTNISTSIIFRRTQTYYKDYPDDEYRRDSTCLKVQQNTHVHVFFSARHYSGNQLKILSVTH